MVDSCFKNHLAEVRNNSFNSLTVDKFELSNTSEDSLINAVFDQLYSSLVGGRSPGV